VLVPLKVSVPVPLLFKAPAPLMIPLKVSFVFAPPVVRSAPKVIAPAPATEPTVSDVAILSVAPLATLTTPVSIIAPPPVSERVPADTVVAPL
jgi:hypothetical protein